MTGFRVPGPGRIHVFCEGETEVLYLQDFCRLIGLSGKKAVISVCPVKNPARAIEWICRQVPGVSKASAASPECWLVFDRDRHEPEFPSRFRFYTESEPLPTSLISVSCS